MSQAATAGASAPANPRVTEAPARRRVSRKALLRPILMLGGIAAIAIGSGAWWLTGGRYEDTDNAYVQGDIAVLSARVEGTVQKILVGDNQRVHAGEPLIALDPTDLKAQLDQV